MKKLKKESDLPSWFDICKYNKASNLGLNGWFEQLSNRGLLLEAINRMHKNPDDTASKDQINRYFSHINLNPIFNKDDSPFSETERKYYGGTPYHVESVNDLDVSFFRYLYTSLDSPKADKQVVTYIDNGQLPENLDIEALKKFLWGPFCLACDPNNMQFYVKVPLTVNLRASDEQLIADFKLWLKQTRKSYNRSGIEKMFNRTDFDEWVKYAILPYFDLTIWAKYNNVEFTNYLLGKAIFPNFGIDGFCPVSRIGKETIRRSADFFTYETSSAMKAQVKKMRV